MGGRQLEGAALLIAGHGVPGLPALDPAAVHTLGQIGEALLATGAAWQIRRLTAMSGERYGADRASLKRNLDELVAEPVRVAVVVIAGAIVEVRGAPALVTGGLPIEYPDEATLPLAWIGERLRAARAEQLVVVLSASGDGEVARWLTCLGTEQAHHVVAVDRPAAGNPAIDALLTGLCGEALDKRTGTVTMASLCEHVVRLAPSTRLQPSEASETLAQPPPLGGLWDVRRSQLAHRPPRPRVADGPDDLTGSVLPGRFRLDAVVARGTFGTIYRARQLAVERDVAIKVLHAEIDPSSDDGRLFVHEIRSVGRIDHPNVVRIHQADMTHDGRLFFAMELLGGRDLQELAGDGKLPRVRAIELVRQLLAGLGAAHDAGLVHSDIKPANAILLPGRDGGERVVLVDFGLSRLRAPDRPAASAGGTPAYMAPEQLHEGRVDARSDLFSAALVLVHLLTGWRRPNAYTLVPPLDLVDDPDLRAVLRRALDVDPAKRFQTAHELAAALTGVAAVAPEVTPATVLPFRHLAPLTEADRGRLHGREADLAVLAELALFRRSAIYTAPSGTGKTSILRAGLLPRLEALGIQAIYHRCRAASATALAAEIWPGAPTVADAIAARHASGAGKLVLALDQLESLLAADEPGADLVRDVLAFDRWPAAADVSVILSIREDYLGRLVARTQQLEVGMPIVRLPPLGPDGARAAIVGPLTEARLAIEPALLDALLADLVRAAAAIGPEMGWGATPAVFPPHLQLACSVLYDALAPGAATLTLADYRRLGGFAAIVGEHLERVIDTELAGGRDVIARDLFLALVTGAHERAVRPDSELLAIVGATHGADAVTAVLEVLRARGLLVRVRDAGGEPGWELVHDSLVPRVLAWIDRRDLDRRRAVEVVRYHLRRSRPDAPSLLGRAELRELRAHAGALAELDAEWQTRGSASTTWKPARLVLQSTRALRRRTAIIATIVIASLAIASLGMYRSHVEAEAAELRRRQEEERARQEAERVHQEERLKQLDLGRFELAIEGFDWDPEAQQAIAVAPGALRGLRWELHLPDRADREQPGAAFEPAWVVRGAPRIEGKAIVEDVEARGGHAFLVVARDGCPPSIIPLQNLPGYAQRSLPQQVHVRVPTCQATRADMIELAAVEFIYGGPGEPPSRVQIDTPESGPEEVREQPAFRMDRTEVTNAAFAVFAGMSDLSGIRPRSYPDSPGLTTAGGPRRPVAGINWIDARSYCRFLGKELPTTYQWTRALRGGTDLGDGARNPMPRRNFPWGATASAAPAKLLGVDPPGTADVGSFPLDRSPDGVVDLAGNVTEWTSSGPDDDAFHYVRGGNWTDIGLARLADFTAIQNVRLNTHGSFEQGVRCVLGD